MPARICPSIGWFSVSVTAASPLAETAAGDTARTRRTLLRHRRVSGVTEMRGPTRGLHCNDDCRIADEAGAHDGFEDATPRALRARARRAVTGVSRGRHATASGGILRCRSARCSE